MEKRITKFGDIEIEKQTFINIKGLLKYRY